MGKLAIISATLEGKNTLVVQSTGAGKSLCFQFPCVATKTLTVVLMPTISLIKDQYHHLEVTGPSTSICNPSSQTKLFFQIGLTFSNPVELAYKSETSTVFLFVGTLILSHVSMLLMRLRWVVAIFCMSTTNARAVLYVCLLSSGWEMLKMLEHTDLVITVHIKHRLWMWGLDWTVDLHTLAGPGLVQNAQSFQVNAH